MERITDTYHQWRNLAGTYADVKSFCKATSLEEVEKHGYALSPGRYVVFRGWRKTICREVTT